MADIRAGQSEEVRHVRTMSVFSGPDQRLHHVAKRPAECTGKRVAKQHNERPTKRTAKQANKSANQRHTKRTSIRVAKQTRKQSAK